MTEGDPNEFSDDATISEDDPTRGRDDDEEDPTSEDPAEEALVEHDEEDGLYDEVDEEEEEEASEEDSDGTYDTEEEDPLWAESKIARANQARLQRAINRRSSRPVLYRASNASARGKKKFARKRTQKPRKQL